MKPTLLSALIAGSLFSAISQATIVEFQTSQGNFKVNLHDQTTPQTVDNFLTYVNEGRYDNTIIHRTVDNFVIQGGGAEFEGQMPPTWIATNDPIENEPVYSNVRGTISMAKQGGAINSATSQWFINLTNNASSLDPIDIYGGGAYAVFGEVIDDGMGVVDAIAGVARCETPYAGFQELPMINYSDYCDDTSAVPSQENFVTVYSVTVYDDTVVTDTDLASVPNTRYNQSPGGNSVSGGGSMFWLFGSLLALPWLRRKP